MLPKPYYTFYRLGPNHITSLYPVDNDFIEAEILSPNGIIGPKFYENEPEAIEHLNDFNNDWLRTELSPEALEHLKADLLLLAEEHGIASAYTILGSISNEFKEQIGYFKLAAEAGVKEGMVSYGLFSCTDNNLSEGLKWIEKGADLGDEIGMLTMAITLQYGTLTTIDYNRAAHYYRRLIAECNSFYALVNLGVMYVDANYFHTAFRLFSQANALCDEKERDRLSRFGNLRLMENAESCRILLNLPVESRRKHAVIQHHSHQLEAIFMNNKIAPPTVYNSDENPEPKTWTPDEMSEIEPADIAEHESASLDIVPNNALVKYPYDDFVFPTIKVEIRNPEIFGNQHELVFLEKNAHFELNQYIQQNLTMLRASFRRIGYHFTYLPAHTISYNDLDDLLGTYFNTYGSIDIKDYIKSSRTFHSKTRDESSYWEYLFSKEELPADCAGFLRHTPRIADVDRRPYYDYILFPYQPGTYWDKAFLRLFDYLATLPFVDLKTKKHIQAGSTLVIDESFNIFIIDADGSPIGEVKMSILPKTLFFLLLRYRNGVAIKCLSDYRDDLLSIYSMISNRQDINRSINDLIDPTKNSANEKISRIRQAFDKTLSDFDDESRSIFSPQGKRGEAYYVKINRNQVIWKPTSFNIFDTSN